MPKVKVQQVLPDEECCQNCKKWLRINNYKGYCANNPDNPHEFTYEEDWCQDYKHY